MKKLKRYLLTVLVAMLLLGSVLAAPAQAQQATSGTIVAQVTRNSTSFKAWISAGKSTEYFQPGCRMYMYRQGQYVYGKDCTYWNNGSIGYPASSGIPCQALQVLFYLRNRGGYTLNRWLNAC